MENVKVFQLNEFDSVAAFSLEEAKEWYRNETGLSSEEAFYDYIPHERGMEEKVYTDETCTDMQSLESVVKECWRGEPFIATSSH